MICRCVDGPLAGHVVIERYPDGSVRYGPCPDCGGSTIVHCCEGSVGWREDVTNNPLVRDGDT
jgi:hypothetical protein